MAGGPVRADPPDLGAFVPDLAVEIAELAGLGRAAGRVVLRIEVDERPSVVLVGQAVDGPVLVGQCDLGSAVADRGVLIPAAYQRSPDGRSSRSR